MSKFTKTIILDTLLGNYKKNGQVEINILDQFAFLV